MTHTSYEVSKKLKEFLGDSSIEPIGKIWHLRGTKEHSRYCPDVTAYPAYTLEDLLSKPFCEAITKKRKLDARLTGYCLYEQYRDGGFPAVEKELLRLMEDK